MVSRGFEKIRVVSNSSIGFEWFRVVLNSFEKIRVVSNSFE